MKKINFKRFLFNWIICFALMMPATLLKAQTTLVLQPDNTTGKDAYVYFQDTAPAASSTNYGESTNLEAKRWTASGQPKGSRSFLEFDLSSIPSSESIISATLSLYHDGSTTLHGGGDASRYSQSSFYIRRVTSAWLENTVTWDNQPTATTQNQVAVPAPTSGTTDYPDIDVTQLIKDIIDNGNYGLQLILQNEAIYRLVRFGSCENDLDGGANRPKLEVVYQSSALPPTDGLIAQYKFDGTSGEVVDETGNYSGTSFGATRGIAGKVNNAFSFDGNDDYVAINMYYDAASIGPFSVSSWVKVPSDGGAWSIIDFDRSEYFTCAVGIVNGGSDPGNYIGFHTSYNGSTNDLWSNYSGIRDDLWHHIVWVFDGSTKYIYVDGSLDVTQNVSGVGSTDLRYGIIGDGSEATSFNGSRNDRYFKGSIDEIRIYNRTIDATEVQVLYNELSETTALTRGTISTDNLIIDYNTSPGEISGSLPTGGDCNGIYIYAWEASTDGGNNWTSVGGNTQSYTPEPLVQTTTYRRIVGCNTETAISEMLTITVGPEIMPCANTISSFPYTESFESSTYSWENYSENELVWTRLSGSTPSINTGPSSASHSSYYCYIECGEVGSPHIYETVILLGPCFDLSDQSSIVFSFDYHMYGDDGNISEDMGELYFEISNDGATWSSVWSKSGNQGDEWKSASVDLNSYAGSTMHVRFRGETIASLCDMAIDNLRLSTVPITELIAGTLQVENPTIYSGYSPGLISDSQASTGGDCSGTYEYSWQYLEDGESSWVDISNEDGASYEPGALTVTTTFRRTVTCGSETASSEITITVLEGGTSTPIIIGTPANGLSLTDQVLTLDVASSTSTGALTSTDWNTFNSNDYYGYWWFQAGTGPNAAIGSGDKISLVAGDGIAITESVSTDGKDRDVTFSVIGGGTVSDGNNHPNALTFNAGTGDLTLGIEGMSDLVENLDGRYMLGSNTLELNDLNDVTISNPQNGQVLKLVDNVWQASADLLGETGTGDDWGTQVVQTDGTTITGDGDITPISLLQQGATDGQILKWSDTLGRWAPGQDNSGTGSQSVVTDNLTLTGTGSELDSLKLAQQGAANGQVLKWNDSLNRWAPGSDIGLEGSSTMWQSSGNNIYYSSGSVSVGLEDTTQNLNVNGTIYSKEVKVQTVIPQPDYVFEEDYPLKSLSSVESFINENKHLPEIPSAKEVAKNGVDLAAMNMLLLRKVEELTLYLFQQENRIKELENKLKSNGTSEN